MDSHNQIYKLKEHILGDLSTNSIVFLNDLNLKDDTILKKLVYRFEKSAIYIKSKDFDLIINALKIQTNLSLHILQTIHLHLQDESVRSIYNTFMKMAKKLEKDLPEIDTLHSILTMMNNLQIFVNNNSEEKFIRSILVLMLNFHLKQHNNNHNNHLDSAKWMKSLLSISEKSCLIQLVDFIAIRLSLAKIAVNCDGHNTELTEIYFILEELLNSSEIETCKQNNKNLIKNINGCVLISIICNKNPHIFADIVTRELQDDNSNIWFLTKKFSEQPNKINELVNGHVFQTYYKNNTCYSNINLQTFLINFTNFLHQELINKHNESIKEIQALKDLIITCNQNSEKMSDKEYKDFLFQKNINHSIIEAFENKLLPSILSKLKETLKNTKTINFAANKLTILGFAPRSVSFSAKGIFIPLITKNKLQLDYENTLALKKQLHSLDFNKKYLIIKELILSLLVIYRSNPYKLENQPNPIFNKNTNKGLRVSIYHYTKKQHNQEKNQINNSKFQFTFFANKIVQNKNPTPNLSLFLPIPDKSIKLR